MSPVDGHSNEMPVPPLDDRALEALLSGARSAPSGLDWLLPFVEELAEASSQPAPVVRPALAALLAEGSAATSTTRVDGVAAAAAVAAVAPVVALAPAAAWAASPRKHRRLGAKLAGLGLAAKVALGVAVAAASTTVAGAAGVLPGPAQHAVATVVGAATPFTFPGSASPKADFGAKVSTDATGASDGVHGVDGKAVSDAARNKHSGDNGVAGNPTSTTAGNGAGSAVGANDGATGLDRANQTPAAGHVPDSVPASTGPGEHGAKGLDTAATTPAGDHVPTSVPPTTEAGSAHGNNGSTGLTTASTTPAGGHVPSSVPARP